MIAFVADEDFNGRIIRGLRLRVPSLDLITVLGAGLGEQPDPAVISWAATHSRVLLTHDVNTMLEAAAALVRAGIPMRGVIAVPRQIGIGAAISDLALIANCAEPAELDGQIWFLPL